MRTIRNLVIILVLSASLVLCVIAGGLVIWSRQEGLNPLKALQLKISLTRHDDMLNTPAGTDARYHAFDVIDGETANSIALNLLRDGLITNAGLFVDYVAYYRLDSQLQAGTYYLQQTQTIPQIAHALTDASVASITFGFLPGLRLEEVANAVSAEPRFGILWTDFYVLVKPGAPIPPDFKTRMGIPDLMSNGSPPSLEGFLYPTTYKLRPGISALELRDEMLKAFNDTITDEMAQQAAAQGLTLYQVITLASIVQREALADEERPIIASVYLNRLRLPMRLDADPTVQYAIGDTRDGRWWPGITQDDYYGLAGVPNQSYSTYLNDGLPPGPIAAPGLASIKAVLNPATTNYFYFRLGCGGDGRHVFFTLEQQADHANFTCP